MEVNINITDQCCSCLPNMGPDLSLELLCVAVWLSPCMDIWLSDLATAKLNTGLRTYVTLLEFFVLPLMVRNVLFFKGLIIWSYINSTRHPGGKLVLYLHLSGKKDPLGRKISHLGPQGILISLCHICCNRCLVFSECRHENGDMLR